MSANRVAGLAVERLCAQRAPGRSAPAPGQSNQAQSRRSASSLAESSTSRLRFRCLYSPASSPSQATVFSWGSSERAVRVVRETQSGNPLGLVLPEGASMTISAEIRNSASIRRCHRNSYSSRAFGRAWCSVMSLGGEGAQVGVCGVERDAQLLGVASGLGEDEPALDGGKGRCRETNGVCAAPELAVGLHLS